MPVEGEELMPRKPTSKPRSAAKRRSPARRASVTAASALLRGYQPGMTVLIIRRSSTGRRCAGRTARASRSGSSPTSSISCSTGRRPGSTTTSRPIPTCCDYSWRDYGVRVGIWRMMEIMQRYGVNGTVALNSDVCRHYPRIIEEGKKLGWEWMGHGITNSIMLPRSDRGGGARADQARRSPPSPRASASRRAAGSARR